MKKGGKAGRNIRGATWVVERLEGSWEGWKDEKLEGRKEWTEGYEEGRKEEKKEGVDRRIEGRKEGRKDH